MIKGATPQKMNFLIFGLDFKFFLMEFEVLCYIVSIMNPYSLCLSVSKTILYLHLSLLFWVRPLGLYHAAICEAFYLQFVPQKNFVKP